ncbi:notch-regulated ankyrin repeat-containing protein-like [Acanthaster planci]|uniref:Notch-regulated ankyrin repeat-containing protein-like n=1 Tax=Acanthaster planci TaxID=133434 RepID=A0A8B7XVX5_ACAPL|nr:notch-regulated ankyrin repeat-containing protein-like [Acanthaster planci]
MSSTSFHSNQQRNFHEAVRRGDPKELARLLRGSISGAVNVNVFDGEGQTPLHQSVLVGNLELVKLLVQFGADVRLANRDGWNALHIAAYGGHDDIVLYLIRRRCGGDRKR